MNYETLFVGALSVLLGVMGLIAAIVNSDHWYRLDKIRWLEAVTGRWCVRAVYALVGILLIGLGLAIVLGLRPAASAAVHARRLRYISFCDPPPAGAASWNR